jgi:Mn2+/Fe2+ NRAMP family transporter
VKNILEIFLGILTAVGGFVEIGELLFSASAGARFSYHLLWIAVLGTLGIIVYGEMGGRIAAVARKPVFELIRERTGPRLGRITLLAAVSVGWMTCAAEIGGVAIIFRLLWDQPYRLYILVALAMLLLSIGFISFKWIERIFGLGGLGMLIFVVAAARLHPDWSGVASGFVPNMPEFKSPGEALDYAYFAVALLSSIMLPYETYFYASGGIEDGWKREDVPMNRFVASTGFSLGSLLTIALIMLGAQLYLPHGIDPDLPGSAALGPMAAYGRMGLLCALLGMFFAFAGAAIENGLSIAYNIAQFYRWPWGKHRPPRQVRRFTAAWIVVFVSAAVLTISGADPVALVEYSIVFSVVILPLSYYAILRAARDKKLMGTSVNGPIANVLAIFYLVLITLAAVAAIPLMILSHSGKA